VGARAVGGGHWLGTADYAGSVVLRGAELRRADVRAGQEALAEALAAAHEATGVVGEFSYSISHTGGRGAALVGPLDDLLGIDLVPLARVSARHAFAILSPEEWQAIGRYGAALQPALAWALKEAAAKATSMPARWFPDGLRIEWSASGRLVVTVAANPKVTFDADWRVDGQLLCTWVVRRRTHAN
jgi:phosphopantetheinyl transferase (holo-ACP synthase)